VDYCLLPAVLVPIPLLQAVLLAVLGVVVPQKHVLAVPVLMLPLLRPQFQLRLAPLPGVVLVVVRQRVESLVAEVLRAAAEVLYLPAWGEEVVLAAKAREP